MQLNDLLSGTRPVDNEEEIIVAKGPANHLAICALVLDSAGIRYSLHPKNETLTVSHPMADKAKHQLKSYFEENKNWPEQPPTAPARGTLEKQPTILLIGFLAVFFLITGPWNDKALWFHNGAINSAAILYQHEWWRLVTALTLHADLLHVTGNCLIGGFLVHLLVNQLGSGTGWFLLITSGAAGNFLNIATRNTVHYSVGFSTSIFGAIGIFCGLQILSEKKNINLKNLLIPLGAGIGLLAMLGVSGERTDIGAHFFGFVCGLLIGAASSFLPHQRLANNANIQRVLLLHTLGLIVFCWLLAMK